MARLGVASAHKGGTAIPRRKRRRVSAARRQSPLAVLWLLGCALVFAWLMARNHRFNINPPLGAQRMEEARAFNASIPFVAGQPAAARPFHFKGTRAAREQAVQCLATAALYEAGTDRRGQKAVIQVVLNRLALPQYPKTICGVVYQGATRTTGCQFSFTCDGSLVRRPEHAGWRGARAAARRALSGYVFKPVGTATHYHADWTVPYWMPTLDKIAQVGTHIFYRPHRG